MEEPSSSPDTASDRSAILRAFGFEYLDHTADILLHSVGDTMAECFENAASGMVNYMTDLSLALAAAVTTAPTAGAHGSEHDSRGDVYGQCGHSGCAYLSDRRRQQLQLRHLFSARCSSSTGASPPPLPMSDISSHQLSSRTFEVEASSIDQMFYSFLSELLTGVFGAERLLPLDVEILVLDRNRYRHVVLDSGGDVTMPEGSVQQQRDSAAEGEDAQRKCYLKCRVIGERWSAGRHVQRTEVKAVTMHGLSVTLSEEDMLFHGYVVLDI